MSTNSIRVKFTLSSTNNKREREEAGEEQPAAKRHEGPSAFSRAKAEFETRLESASSRRKTQRSVNMVKWEKEVDSFVEKKRAHSRNIQILRDNMKKDDLDAPSAAIISLMSEEIEHLHKVLGKVAGDLKTLNQTYNYCYLDLMRAKDTNRFYLGWTKKLEEEDETK